MNLTKKVLLLIGIISFSINLVASSMEQTSSQSLSQTNKELNDQLLLASERGTVEYINVEYIKSLVYRGANVNALDSSCWTALHHLAGHGRIECIRILVDLGANVDAQDKQGRTALHNAARWGNIECIKVLVDLGANIEAQDYNGLTALRHAARIGRVECVKELIGIGVNIEAQDNLGETALHCAANNGCVECVRVLIDLGANVEARNNLGETALHCAARHGYDWTIKVLLELRANPRVRDKRQKTVLDLAALHCTENKLKAVIKLSYLLLHPPEGNLHSARNRVSASLWALSHGPVVEDSQTGERRRIGLPTYPRLWILLSDSDDLSNADKCYGDKSLSKAVVYIFLKALRDGKSNKLNLLMNAKNATVQYLIEELKKLFAHLKDLPNIKPDRAELLDPDSIIVNFKSDVLAGINERIDELNERIQDDTVSSLSAVSLSSEK